MSTIPRNRISSLKSLQVAFRHCMGGAFLAGPGAAFSTEGWFVWIGVIDSVDSGRSVPQSSMRSDAPANSWRNQDCLNFSVIARIGIENMNLQSNTSIWNVSNSVREDWHDDENNKMLQFNPMILCLSMQPFWNRSQASTSSMYLCLQFHFELLQAV